MSSVSDNSMPKYYKDVLYEIVWDNQFNFPCLIVNTKDISEEALEEFNKAEYSKKVPVVYFCAEDEANSGIIDLSDTSKFSYASIFKYKELNKNQPTEDNFCSAVTTAYFCKKTKKGEDRLEILEEVDAGCCDCFSSEIKSDDLLDGFVCCDKCLLAYHWKCEGFKEVPKDIESYNFVCKRCSNNTSDSNRKDNNSSIKRSRTVESDDRKLKKVKLSLDLNPTAIKDNVKGNIKKKSIEFIQRVYSVKRVREKLVVFDGKESNSFENLKSLIDSSSGCLIDHEVMKNVYPCFKEIIQNVKDKKELTAISKYLKELKSEYNKSEDPKIVKIMYQRLKTLIDNITDTKFKTNKSKNKEKEKEKEKEKDS